MNLTGLKPGHLTRQLGKSLGDPRRTQNLSHRLGLFIGEPQNRSGFVRIIAAIQDDVETATAPGNDADPVTAIAGELVSQAHPRQQHLLDVHRSQSLTKCGQDRSGTGNLVDSGMPVRPRQQHRHLAAVIAVLVAQRRE